MGTTSKMYLISHLYFIIFKKLSYLKSRRVGSFLIIKNVNDYKIITKKKKGLTKEDIFIRDLYYADMDRYTYSPNSDANRSYREVFGGDLTNYARRR